MKPSNFNSSSSRNKSFEEKDLIDWTEQDVCDCIKHLNRITVTCNYSSNFFRSKSSFNNNKTNDRIVIDLSKIAFLFKLHCIQGEDLLHLTSQDLVELFTIFDEEICNSPQEKDQLMEISSYLRSQFFGNPLLFENFINQFHNQITNYIDSLGTRNA
ncbi:hypothetical protein ABK040_006343 [Willaertia magna]